jgi:hypothetical protein
MNKKLILPVLLIIAACSGGTVWNYDVNYTRDLLFNYSGYRNNGDSNSASSVDVIQGGFPIKNLKTKKIGRRIEG